MIKNLSNIFNSNSQVMKNMTWLTILQFANYLIPMLIMPYIVRVLGTDVFGRVSYAQNIIFYLTLIINYGFEYSATQEIAIHKSDSSKVRYIFWTVLRFKGFLLLVTFFILGVLAFTFDKVQQDKLLYLYAALINIGFVLFPSWFFQGIEKMSKITLFNFAIKLSGVILIILFIHKRNDYPYYLLILSLSYILVGILSIIYVIVNFKLYPTFKKANEVVFKGFPIFINNFFSNIYTALGLTMLGFFVSEHELGIYSGAYRIIMAVLMISSYPINVALFPVISRKFNMSIEDGLIFYKKIFRVVVFFAIISSIIIYLFSDIIVRFLLGAKFVESIPVLHILSFLPFLVIVASMLTVQGMYGLQLQKFAPYIGFLIFILSLGINYYLIKNNGIYGAAWGYVLAEIMEITFVFTLLYYSLKRKKALI